MRSVLRWGIGVTMVAVALTGQVGAQDRPAAASTDPRVGLKGGLHNAGVAAKNMQLTSTLPRPEGFFDPDAPAGPPSPPERAPGAPPPANAAPPAPAAAPAAPAAPATPPRPGGLDFANSDMAFAGTHMWVGNFHGFNTYDIENARRPRLVTSVVCPGGQGDVSVWGHLLFMSVEQTRGRVDCGVQGIAETVSKERFRGVRIFDITDIRKPRQVASVQTCRGSHTHTLVPVPGDPSRIYVYGSGTSTVRSGEELDGCVNAKPEDNENTALFSIDVIEVPLAAPQDAKVVNRPRIFGDEKSIAALWRGGDSGPGTQRTAETNQCHDITVYPAAGLAAGACSGNGILLDISDPVHPKRLDHVFDKNFAYWHSATFNNAGTTVLFTDEWGGGTRPRCRATDSPTWGANAIFDIVDKKMTFKGYYKLPAPQTEQENCVAHNGSLIPVPGRDIMVQAWYQGGLSVFDFTDSAKPVEIAFFDRGPLDEKNLITGGYWSTYWYNGQIYGAEIARGIDIFRLLPSEYLTKNELDAAALIHYEEFNAQQQPEVVWPATAVVAKAYIDQLNRSRAIQPERAKAVASAMDRAEGIRSPRDRNAAQSAEQLTSLATQLESDAAAATGRDQARLKALAETLKGRAARLK